MFPPLAPFFGLAVDRRRAVPGEARHGVRRRLVAENSAPYAHMGPVL